MKDIFIVALIGLNEPVRDVVEFSYETSSSRKPALLTLALYLVPRIGQSAVSQRTREYSRTEGEENGLRGELCGRVISYLPCKMIVKQ